MYHVTAYVSIINNHLLRMFVRPQRLSLLLHVFQMVHLHTCPIIEARYLSNDANWTKGFGVAGLELSIWLVSLVVLKLIISQHCDAYIQNQQG